MSTQFTLLIDPATDISIETLAHAWAQIPECAGQGRIVRMDAPRESFDMDLGSLALGALVGAGGSITKDLILILIKRALEKADAKAEADKAKKTKVRIDTDPRTGLPLLRISRDD